jgi:hypothetical protein
MGFPVCKSWDGRLRLGARRIECSQGIVDDSSSHWGSARLPAPHGSTLENVSEQGLVWCITSRAEAGYPLPNGAAQEYQGDAGGRDETQHGPDADYPRR